MLFVNLGPQLHYVTITILKGVIEGSLTTLTFNAKPLATGQQ